MPDGGNILSHRITRFILVGILNTLFGYSLFALFVFLGMHYTAAVFFATILSLIFNFKTFGKWVFKTSHSRLIFKFVFGYVILYFINILLIKLFMFYFHNVYFSGAFAVTLTALCSYLINSRWVFHRGETLCINPQKN